MPHHLMMNPTKTEFLWLSTPIRKHLMNLTYFALNAMLLFIVPTALQLLIPYTFFLVKHFFYQSHQVKAICYYIQQQLQSVQLQHAFVIIGTDCYKSNLLSLPSCHSASNQFLNVSAYLRIKVH